MPLIRVIIPTYNRAPIISHALQSVLSQTLTDFEIMIADDGSTDNTEDIISSITAQDRRIHYFRIRHSGAAAARNAAIQQPGTFAYVAFLDSDDVWTYRDHLKIAVTTFANNPEVGFVFARFETFDHTGRHWTREQLQLREQRLSWPSQNAKRTTPEGAILMDRSRFFLRLLQGELAALTSTVVLRADSMGDGPWFNTSMETLEDIIFFTRLARDLVFGFFDVVHCRARYFGDNLTRPVELASPDALSRSQALLLHAKHLYALCRTREERKIVMERLAGYAYLVGQCLSEQSRYTEAQRAYLEALHYRLSLQAAKSIAGTILRQMLSIRLRRCRTGRAR